MKRCLLGVVILYLMAMVIISASARAETEKKEPEPTVQSKISGLKMFIDLTTMEEHRKMMKMMKMEMKMEPEVTHHLSVNLEDEKTSKKITDAVVSVICLSSDGKEVDSGTLGYMPKMAHFGGNIRLKEKGKYYIKIVVYLEEIKTRYGVTIPFVVL